MALKKRIFIVFMVVCMTVGIVNSDYQEAKAFAIGIPIVIVLMLAAGAICVEAGVDIPEADWNDFTGSMCDSLFGASDATTKQWFDQLATKAVTTAGITLISQLANGNIAKTLDLWSYFVPIGTIVDMTASIKNAISDFICNRIGSSELEVDSKIQSGTLTDIEKAYISNIETYYSQSYSVAYPYYLIIESSQYYNIIYGSKPFVANNSEGYLCVVENDINSSGIGSTYGRDIMYNTNNSSYVWKSHSPASQMNPTAIGTSTTNKIIQSNHDILTVNLNTNIISQTIFHAGMATIPATTIELQNENALDVIPINNDLAADVVGINADNVGDITSTDQLMNITADTIADTSTKTTTDIWDKIKDLPNTIAQGIETALTKVFVPDATKVKEFVDTAKSKWDEKAGILSYPLELVIRFLNELNEQSGQDCIMTFPAIAWQGYTLSTARQFNLTEYVHQEHFRSIYQKYLMITDAIMIIAVVWLAKNKGEEILTGGIKG